MGLFRRANKLLRLGGGLRNCCCRPENPDACWCPTFCEYYFSWPGGLEIPAAVLLSRLCEPRVDSEIDSVASGPYGLVVSNVSKQPRASASRFYYGDNTSAAILEFEAAQLVTGFVSQATYDAVFPEFSGGTEALRPGYYLTVLRVRVECVYDWSAMNSFPTVGISLWQYVYAVGQGGTLPRTLFSKTVSASKRWGRGPNLPSDVEEVECVLDASKICPCEDVPGSPPSCPKVRTAHVLPSVFEVEVTTDSIKLNGETLDLNVENDESSDVVAWQIEGLYPLTDPLSVTVKSKASCEPGPCRCSESLTGLSVVFEGKAFTYGSLESFTEGTTTWEETSAGLFRRTDYESCDGTYVAYVRQAEIDCDTSGAEDLWIVYLDAECYERDEATCPAAPDGRRDMGWTGVFTCGPDGKPSGSPHSATDAADPPDEDYNTTGPTPTAECAADLAIPSISFG